MQKFPSILADDSTAIIKVVFWVIIMVIWGISSLVSAVKKKLREEEARARVAAPALNLTRSMEVPAARPATGRRPAVSSTLAPPLKKPAVRGPAPALPSPPVIQKSSRDIPVLPVTLKAPSRAAQLALRLRPESLKTQWLLTEILGKPLALRENGAPRQGHS